VCKSLGVIEDSIRLLGCAVPEPESTVKSFKPDTSCSRASADSRLGHWHDAVATLNSA